jgi:hypothetical protein
LFSKVSKRAKNVVTNHVFDTDTRPTGSGANQDDNEGKNDESHESHDDEGDEGKKGGGNEDNEGGDDDDFTTAPPPSPLLCPRRMTASPPPSRRNGHGVLEEIGGRSPKPSPSGSVFGFLAQTSPPRASPNRTPLPPQTRCTPHQWGPLYPKTCPPTWCLRKPSPATFFFFSFFQ